MLEIIVGIILIPAALCASAATLTIGLAVAKSFKNLNK